MTLTTSNITGRVPLPSDSAPKYAEVVFTLTKLDTEGDQVIPGGAGARFVLDANGDMPAGATLWRNTEGLRATAYRMVFNWDEFDRTRGTVRRTHDAGLVQVGDLASYTIAQLINNTPVPVPAETYWSSITQEQYDIAIAAAAAAALSAAHAALYDGYRIDSAVSFGTDAILTYDPDEPGTVVEGSAIYSTAEGLSLTVLAADAVYWDFMNTRGVKLLTRSRAAFLPDLAQAVADVTWTRQKHLLTADLQPIDAGQVTRFRSVLDTIAARHPDLTHAHVIGDLVDRPTLNDTGEPFFYSFPEFLADWRDRLPIPLARFFPIPGNHDRNGTGTGAHRDAWSMQSYRSEIGPEYYYTLQGNLIRIYAGDMGGSNPGTITNSVVEWMRRVALGNTKKNLLIHVHQPYSGCYRGVTEASDPIQVQAGSARLTALLDEVAAGADNIAAVFYGHVGSEFQFNDETHHGTRHIQIGMHIPSNVSAGRNDQYYTMDLAHGAASIPITRWDATADVEMDTKLIELKYPLELAPEFTFDGRKQGDPTAPSVSPAEIMVPVDTFRNALTPFALPTTAPLWLFTIGAEDRSFDDIPEGFAVGQRVRFPGVNVSGTDYDDAATGAYIDNLGLVWRNTNGGDSAPDVALEVWLAENGIVENSVAFYPSGDPRAGVWTPHNVTVGDFSRSQPDTSAVFNQTGAALNKNGVLTISGDTFSLGYLQRQTTDGFLAVFRKGITTVGSISVSGSTTSFATTSDARLKEDLLEFDGLSSIMALAVYDYAWSGTTDRARGVMAQEAQVVAPYAVTEGGEDPVKEPWQVDYSKLIPDLIRAVQQLNARISELEQQSS